MKRILLVTQNFYPELGSGSNRMKNLFHLFTEKGYKVYVLTTEPSYPNKKMYENEKYFDDSVLNQKEEHEIIRLKMSHEKQKNDMKSRIYYYLEFMYKVHFFVKSSSHLFDIIYVTSPNIFAPWGTFFLQPKSEAKKILEVRDLWPDSVAAIEKINIQPLLKPLKWLEKKMYDVSDRIIVNNQSFVPHIKEMTDDDKPILFVPNGIRKDEIRLQEKYAEFSVIYSGNIGFAQNFEMLCDLAEKFNTEKVYFNTIIYGANASKFRDFVISHRLNYVNVYPPMTRTECIELTSKNHVALSILKETDVFLNVLPGKVVDAICTHVPIVTNLGGYTNELINKYKVGYAKESATVEELLFAVLEYRKNPELRALEAKNAKKLEDDLFVWEKNIDKIIEFIE